MPSGKDIRRRIKGVKGTGKITRAMEMISAVKMRRAIERAVTMRPYALAALRILARLSLVLASEDHPLTERRAVARELIVVITSNRGLCGAFNAQIGRKVRMMYRERKERVLSFITIGRKGDALIRRLGGDIIASFPDIINLPSTEAVRPIVNILLQEFESKRIDRVTLVSTDFVSVMSQRVISRELLPFSETEALKTLEEKAAPVTGEFLIEPAPEAVLSVMVRRLLEAELFHAVLESNASQEASRMLAMRNATDAAKEMAADLTLAYNQLRQGKITQEIAELSAGMAAVQG
ncbi:MAG: ATP synthase F1 subunit gamma [Candidatus Moraniibacteriota bacterium]|nr:MAG: ATP synthase F1 subunit gamma [Candidatus Moranbacteria bacterium]